MKSALEYIGAVRLVRRGNHEQWSNPSRNFLLLILFLLHPAQNIKKNLWNTFVAKVLCLIPNWFPMLALNCTSPRNPFVSHFALHARVHLSFSPFLRRLFNFCAPPFLTLASYRVPQVGFPQKNPPLNINGRHSVQVQGIHANAPPGHPIDSNAPRMEKNSRVNRFTLANITGIRTWYMMQGILQSDFYFLPPLIISNYRNIIWLGLASRE